MVKYLFSLVVYLLAPFLLVKAQTPFTERVPKQYSLETGYLYHFSHTFSDPLSTMGGTVLFDYAWQVSGFDKKPAAFVSLPLGYSYLSNPGQNLRIFHYGWTIRHELLNDKPLVPFLGHAIIINHMQIKGQEGAIYGRQVRFTAGLNIEPMATLYPFVKADYSFTAFPRLGQGHKDYIHSLFLKVGIRFNRKYCDCLKIKKKRR